MEEEKMKDMMRVAVAEGIKDVISDPATVEKFWDSAVTTLQNRAKLKIGDGFLGIFGGLFKRLFWFAALAALVYSLGGWSALVKLWYVLFSS